MKYVGLYKDPQDIATKANVDAVATRVSTNESDIEGLQTSVGNIQTTLGSKQDVIDGAASTITDSNLTANRALISNSSGKVDVSAVTSTELGYLDGVTSNIQTQLNSKLSAAPVTSVNSKTGEVKLTAADVSAVPTTRTVNGHALSANVTVSKSDVGLGNVDNVKQYSASNPPPYPVTSVNGQTGAVTVKGVEIVMQAAQPSGQSTGDFWYQTTT